MDASPLLRSADLARAPVEALLEKTRALQAHTTELVAELRGKPLRFAEQLLLLELEEITPLFVEKVVIASAIARRVSR